MKAIVIGTGRVGLPLALALMEAGVEVTGVDLSPSIRQHVNELLRMPFHEPGFDEILATGKLRIVEDVGQAPDTDYYVLTVGTPLLHHIETDLSAVTRALIAVCKRLERGQTIVLRSTTAPGTTDYAARLIERETGLKVGRDVFVACCPERIVEGKAREELAQLPQIVGANDSESGQRAAKLFATLGPRMLLCSAREAELVKLFNNTSRYLYFAVANALSMIAVNHDVEPYRVLELANEDYPRKIVGLPGFTAGTCLRKDFGMLSEASTSGDILIEAWRINESMPRFLVEQLKLRRTSLSTLRIGVLGYTFKKDADDVRDSLAVKLLRYLQRETPSALMVHDPYVGAPDIEPLHGLAYEADLGRVVGDSDVILIATNHSLYTSSREQILEAAAQRRAIIVDLWNCLNTGRVWMDFGSEA
jgi:UDP-N-acetyl-D-mannosaminuronic acid dehydrogenase